MFCDILTFVTNLITAYSVHELNCKFNPLIWFFFPLLTVDAATPERATVDGAMPITPWPFGFLFSESGRASVSKGQGAKPTKHGKHFSLFFE